MKILSLELDFCDISQIKLTKTSDFDVVWKYNSQTLGCILPIIPD